MPVRAPSESEVQVVLSVLTEANAFAAGKTIPCSRGHLVAATGFSDRLVRACIREIDMTTKHAVGHGAGGYYLATDPTEIRQMAAELFSRAERARERGNALMDTACHLIAERSRQGRLFG
jgi:hypothetical protein